MSGGWLEGYGGTPRPARPQVYRGSHQPTNPPPPQAEREPPPPPPKGTSGKSGPLSSWRRGQVRAVVEVACCGGCGSLRVRIRTNRGKDTVLMECLDCGKTWKDERANRLA